MTTSHPLPEGDATATIANNTGLNAPVLEHRVFFFIPFTYNERSMADGSASKVMEDFVADIQHLPLQRVPQVLGNDLLQDFSEVAPDEPVWKPKSNQAVDSLIPVFRQLVGAPGGSGEQPICEAFTLAKSQFLERTRQNIKRLFLLTPKPARQVCFGDPSLYVFLSGIGVIVLPVTYSLGNKRQLETGDILSGNYFLTHPSVRKDKQAEKQTVASEKAFLTATSLAEFARALLPDYVSNAISVERYFVYSAVRFAPLDPGRSDQERLLAHRLAHRQNANYVPTDECIRKNKLENFDYFIHAAALEGGATLILAEDASSQFHTGMITNQISNTYLPLLVSEIHSQYWLLRQTEALSYLPSGGALARIQGSDRDKLESLNRRLLNFRRFYHYPFPSRLTPHNEFHALWQSVFGIERLLQFLAETANEASEEARGRQLSIITVASGGISGLVIAQQLLAVFRDRELDNMYVWQSRLFVERADLLRDSMAVTGMPDWKQKLQRLDAEIATTTQLAKNWEDYYFFGSLAGLVLGILLAQFFRLRK